MKIIKKGNPYRKHKCYMCKTIFAYHLYEDIINTILSKYEDIIDK